MSSALAALALTDLGRDALNVLAGLALVVFLALALTVSSLTTLFGGIATPSASPSATALAAIPAGQLPVMEAAASICGLPWPVLAGIAKVESDFGRDMATSSAGAIGYGQFLPSTWAAYGQGGNPYDYHDALPAMARYLCANGAPQDLHAAVFAYNHADWYVTEVLSLAAQYGSLGSEPSVTGMKVVALARSQLGKPYVWGGATPAVGFDCSGLVQWVYQQADIALPRTADEQYAATTRLQPDQLQPGDLVFFAHTYPAPVAITHVGIYIGAGQMISAPTEGDVVRVMPVFAGYWAAHYAGAGRVGSAP